MNRIRRLRPSTKIFLGAVLALGGVYLAYDQFARIAIMNEKFSPLPPGDVNVLGVDTSAGYYILVANQVAQLVIGKQSSQFAAPDKGSAEDSDKKRRVPLREVLLSLKGDEVALGKLVMTLNGMSSAELPAYPTVWKAEDIQKALAGDPVLKRKLEQDINITLEGEPLETIKVKAIQEGIVIDSPVPIRTLVNGKPVTLTARIQEEFRSHFMADLDKQLSEKSDLTIDTVRGYYRVAAQELLNDPRKRQDIRASLTGRIDKETLADFAELPEKILNSMKVVVNDSLMDWARADSKTASDGDLLTTLTIGLNDEGRKRLWQYSRQKRGSQLLVVWDGIAVAAPRIDNEIPFAEVKITQLPDQTLANDTVAAINELATKRKNVE